jgi:hypothetical protein
VAASVKKYQLLSKKPNGRRDPPHSSHDTLYPQKLALTSPTSVSQSVACGQKETQFAFLHSVEIHPTFRRKISFISSESKHKTTCASHLFSL